MSKAISNSAKSRQPSRTWSLVLSLGIPLSIVGVSAMAISYATLIDVARVNGLPLPELFPVLVDVGTVASMIAAAQFRLRGVDGRWLAYATFVALSAVSIVANSTHAWRAADMTVTTPWAAALLAATPPAALLAITHLVMMLVPDEKERAKLQREHRPQQSATRERAPLPTPQPMSIEPTVAVASPAGSAGGTLSAVRTGTAPRSNETRVFARARVLEHYAEHGEKPTGAMVGDWLGGKTPKTGQRLLADMAAEGVFDEEPVVPSVRAV